MSRSVFSEPYEVLLQALVEGRRSAGLRQADLAELLGKPQSFVSKYETGERRLDVVELLVVSRSIGLDPHILIERIAESMAADVRI
jgi:transcriptional regulator with XRE-family HTH domain